jgi:TolA-binding protein
VDDVSAEFDRVRQTKTTLLQNIEKHLRHLVEEVSRFSALERQEQELALRGRQLSLRSMAELEALEAEERAEEQVQLQAEAQAAEASTSAAGSGFDWSLMDVSTLPDSWLRSPPPLGDLGSSDRIPPTFRGNSNS